MRVFGRIRVLTVEKHPSSDFNPFTNDRLRERRCTPIDGASSWLARLRLYRSPAGSDFDNDVACLIRCFLRIHHDIDVGVAPLDLLSLTVAALYTAGLGTHDVTNDRCSLIGTKSIHIVSELQH